MSLLLATSQVGVIGLLTLQITIQATPSAAYVQGCAIPSGSSVDKVLQEIQKNHVTSKKHQHDQKSHLYCTAKRVLKGRKNI